MINIANQISEMMKQAEAPLTEDQHLILSSSIAAYLGDLEKADIEIQNLRYAVKLRQETIDNLSKN